jgi:hypothetical protein
MNEGDRRLARLMLPILVEERDAITQTIEGIKRIDAIYATALVAASVVAGIIAADSTTRTPEQPHGDPFSFDELERESAREPRTPEHEESEK